MTTATQTTSRTSFGQIQRALEPQGKFHFEQNKDTLFITRQIGGKMITCSLSKQENKSKLELNFDYQGQSSISYLDLRKPERKVTRNKGTWQIFFEAFKRSEVMHHIDLHSIVINSNCRKYTKRKKEKFLSELIGV